MIFPRKERNEIYVTLKENKSVKLIGMAKAEYGWNGDSLTAEKARRVIAAMLRDFNNGKIHVEPDIFQTFIGYAETSMDVAKELTRIGIL